MARQTKIAKDSENGKQRESVEEPAPRDHIRNILLSMSYGQGTTIK
jgi:hypothetical protein